MKYLKLSFLFLVFSFIFVTSVSMVQASYCTIDTTTQSNVSDQGIPCSSRTQDTCTATPYYHVQKIMTCKWSTSGGSGSTTPPPQVIVTASPSFILEGESSTIEWEAPYATTCNSNGHGTGTTGSYTVSPTAPTNTYSVTCIGNGGSATDTATVNVGVISLEKTTTKIKNLVDKDNPGGVGSLYLDIKVNNITNLPTNGCNLMDLTRNESLGTYSNYSYTIFKPVSSLPNTNHQFQLICKNSSGQEIGRSQVKAVNTQSGVITSPASCDIPSGQSSCSSQIALATTNPQTGVTTVAMRDSIPIPIALGGGNGTIASPTILNVTVPFGIQIFRSFNRVDGETTGTNSDYLELYNRPIEGKCVSGTSWNGTICTPPSNNNKPDLIASSPTPISLNIGTNPTFTSTITNQGVATTGTSFLNLFQTATGFDDALLPVGVMNYPAGSMNALIPGATGYATTTAISFSTAGTYYIRACADKNTSLVGTIDEGASIYENNNCSNGWVKLTVTDPRPDLTASAPTLSSTAILNTPLTFSSTIYNNGINSTGAPFWNIFRVANALNGGGSKTSLAANPVQMTALAGGTSAPITSAQHTFSMTGNYSVQVCADNNALMSGSINESEEGNNCSGWTNVTISSLPLPVVTLTANPTSGRVGVVNPNLTWTTTNNPTSCSASGDWSGTRDVNGGSQLQGILTTVKTYTYHLVCTNGTGNSNTATATVVVSAPALAPDLVISNFTPPASAPVGTLNFTATVRNTGTASTGRTFTNLFQVSTSSNGLNPIDYATPTPTPIIAASGSEDTSRSIPFNTPGTYYIRVCADKSSAVNLGVVTELDEDNNCTDKWSEITITSAIPTGTITASDCIIPNDASTCLSNVIWTTDNLTSGATEVTRNNPNGTHVSYNTSGNISNSINYGQSTFYLYHNNGTTVELANDVANAHCNLNSVWDPAKGTCKIIPLKSDLTAGATLPDQGIVGSSINLSADISNIGNASALNFKNYFQYQKVGIGTIGNIATTSSINLNVGEIKSVSVSARVFNSVGIWQTRACADGTAPDVGEVVTESNEDNNCGPWTNIEIFPGGTLLGNLTATDCTIPLNGSTCDSILNWTTTNPLAGVTSAVTSDYPNFNTLVYTGNSGTNKTKSILGEITLSFFLYHGGNPLDEAVVSATCVSGTEWNGTACVIPVCDNGATNYPACTIDGDGDCIDTGEINPPLCNICANGNPWPDCDGVDTPTNGACSSPLEHYKCASPVGYQDPGGYETTTSFIWTCPGSNGGVPAICSESNGVVIPETPTLSFTASPTWIFRGRSSTLTWSSWKDAECHSNDFVVPSGASMGSVTVSPEKTKEYIITCKKDTDVRDGKARVRVINPNIIEI